LALTHAPTKTAADAAAQIPAPTSTPALAPVSVFFVFAIGFAVVKRAVFRVAIRRCGLRAIGSSLGTLSVSAPIPGPVSALGLPILPAFLDVPLLLRSEVFTCSGDGLEGFIGDPLSTVGDGLEGQISGHYAG